MCIVHWQNSRLRMFFSNILEFLTRFDYEFAFNHLLYSPSPLRDSQKRRVRFVRKAKTSSKVAAETKRPNPLTVMAKTSKI